MLRHTIISEKVRWDDRDDRWAEIDSPELPEIGKIYLLYKRTFVGPNSNHRREQLRWTDDPEMVNSGFPGNSDHKVRRFHGWRGTTNDVSIEALGVRKFLGWTVRDFKKSTRYHLRFGADQSKGMP
jgi:hypothetical protein